MLINISAIARAIRAATQKTPARERIKIADVCRVYSARSEGCRCGCKGKYYSSKADAEAEGQKRGYPLTKGEINDGMVTRIVAILNADLSKTEAEDGWINLQMENGHVYTAYLR